MRKLVSYAITAAVLGLLLVLVPLITIKAEQDGGFNFQAVPARLQQLEGRTYATNVPSWSTELEFLAISFAVALIIYLFLRRKVSHVSSVRTWQYLS